MRDRMQIELFSAASLAPTVKIPPAPILVPHYDWPFPGMSPSDSARSGLSMSSEFIETIIATIKAYPDRAGTDAQVLALIPEDWKALLGPWAHGSIEDRQGRPHGIKVTQVKHEGPAAASIASTESRRLAMPDHIKLPPLPPIHPDDKDGGAVYG